MTIYRFWAVDGDTYSGEDIDLTFKTESEARKAYEAIKAPYKRLARFGDRHEADGLHQVVTVIESYKDNDFYAEV